MQYCYLVENSRRGKLPNGKMIIEKYMQEHGVMLDSCQGRPGPKDIPKDTDCIIVLGGDGTMISTATATAGLNIPIIGINAGRLGYLTSISEENEIVPMLDMLLQGEYTIENRSLLKGSWENNGVTESAYAFNDITITRRAALQTVHMGVSVNGQFLNEYVSDGIIVSTPTGSTAYNLAAGGPIVEADAKVMIITPICPHAFIAGSMVINNSNKIEINIVNDHSRDGAGLAFDGNYTEGFDGIGTITITKADETVPMIRLKGDSYFQTLRRKMTDLQG